ncbi:MAG: PqqD family protein [Bacteroidota bacterium]|nr:PqqD family protein [Bacteroidota bacterium]
MMINDSLKINAPNIVHETIDGETILLNLSTGNYYSLDGAGALIWDYIEKTGRWKKIIEILGNSNQEEKQHIDSSVNKFVAKLIEEELLLLNDTTIGIPENGAAEIEDQLKKAAINYKEPKVNKYSDMQDLLLLDPIHDVNEKGWPEAKEEE